MQTRYKISVDIINSFPILFACFDDENNFNREYFLENVMKYFDIFQEAHTEVPGYSDPLEDNYQWAWETFLNMLGL